jgi:CubicO group peptidase (beta-lactamase class C family)
VHPGRTSTRLLLAVSLAVVAAATAPAAESRTAAAALDRYFGRLAGSGALSGAVVVADGGRVVYERAFGMADRERGLAFTLTTPADGASLAKTFTAAAVLALVQDGRLALDDPARQYVPELPYDVTVRHLVTHSSGLPDYDWFEPFFGPEEIRTAARRLEILRERRPALTMTPGRQFEYNGFGFDLAARVVERISGVSFEDFLRQRFLAPLGMTDTFIRPARLSAFREGWARGYRRRGGRPELFDVLDLEGFYGGGNIWSSARDLARWNDAWVERPPLAPATLATGQSPAVLGEGLSALTLLNLYHSPDRTRFWYHGHWRGFHDTTWRDLARRRSVAFVSNSTIGNDLQSGLVPDVVALLDGRIPAPPPAWKPVREADQPALAGTWTLPAIGDVSVSRSAEGLLYVRYVTGVRYLMVPVDPTVFYTPGLDAWIGFDRDAKGRIDRIVWRTLEGETRGPRSRAFVSESP